MKQVIFLGERENKSTGDNPLAFSNLDKLYDTFEVPEEARKKEIDYMECIMWKPNDAKYSTLIIVRRVELED